MLTNQIFNRKSVTGLNHLKTGKIIKSNPNTKPQPTVLVGVSSGIAAFKVVDLVKRLKSHSYNVVVMMTHNAKKMISEKEFEIASGNPVASELFPSGFDYKDVLERREVEHISLADMASVICVTPATANILAKISHGIADDLLSTTILATNAKLLLCPSMNVNMWNKGVTQKNIQLLKQRGHYFVPPEKGRLACGYEGTGRLASIDKIERAIVKLLHRTSDLKGKRVIVTAGGTEEEIDPVRAITNKSSGKMGIRIAEECVNRGAEVTLIRARTEIDPLVTMKDIRVKTTSQMLDAINNTVLDNDVIIHAAAVSDFVVKNKDMRKISSSKKLTLELVPNIKIIDSIKKKNDKIKLVGFKAETNLSEKELEKRATDMLLRTSSDLVVANDVGRMEVFGSDENEVMLVRRNHVKKVPRANKQIIAEHIVEEVLGLFAEKEIKN
ncbi:phosphopantothenoylcysteine decarboxylase [Anaeramoeba flamelloides]|uniref:Phosphopantothenoylcysteine decarboxylase n=1 Tax=Anaeramoeba flamelloides TaxID=1746091 RepID=A0ABQ8YN79_9EUKA|nr:phosphopantothenoylcysteine decarboxylase [Anaeramoeba flamelloides]